VFAVLRVAPDGERRVLCLHNVSDQTRHVAVAVTDLGAMSDPWLDLLTGEACGLDGDVLPIDLPPYAVRWLKLG